MLQLHKCCQGLRSHVAAHADLDGPKTLTGSLSLINLSLRGLLLNGKIFRSILVSLVRSSVDTSKRSMAKDEETAGVTEHIIPIPQNVLRPSKVLELSSAFSATWCNVLVQLNLFLTEL